MFLWGFSPAIEKIYVGMTLNATLKVSRGSGLVFVRSDWSIQRTLLEAQPITARITKLIPYMGIQDSHHSLFYKVHRRK